MRRGVRLAFATVTIGFGAACGLTLSGSGDLAPDDAGSSGSYEAAALGPASDGTVPTGAADGASTNDASGDAAGGSDARGGSDASSKDAADAAPGTDANPPPDARNDTGTTNTITCPSGGTVSDCAQCSGNPLLCAMCKTSSVEYICVPPGSSCYADYRTSGYDWCRCSPGNPSSCVLPQQECNTYDGGVCVTCGERQTQGFPCKSGGSCNESAAKCQ